MASVLTDQQRRPLTNIQSGNFVPGAPLRALGALFASGSFSCRRCPALLFLASPLRSHVGRKHSREPSTTISSPERGTTLTSPRRSREFLSRAPDRAQTLPICNTHRGLSMAAASLGVCAAPHHRLSLSVHLDGAGRANTVLPAFCAEGHRAADLLGLISRVAPRRPPRTTHCVAQRSAGLEPPGRALGANRRARWGSTHAYSGSRAHLLVVETGIRGSCFRTLLPGMSLELCGAPRSLSLLPTRYLRRQRLLVRRVVFREELRGLRR